MYLASILAANSTRGQKSKRAKSTYPEISVLTQELGEYEGKKCIVFEVVYRDRWESIKHFTYNIPYTINETTGKAKKESICDVRYLDHRSDRDVFCDEMFEMMSEAHNTVYRVRNKNGSSLVEIFKEVEEAKMNGVSLDELVKKYELTEWDGPDQDQLTFEREDWDDSDEE